jgi:tetraacyldisaccharide-1-P 4'-kinase
VQGKSGVAFSGIGDPGGFEGDLRNAGILVVVRFRFADHHWFSPGDLAAVEKAFQTSGAAFVVTTEKDIARLRSGGTEAERFMRRVPLVYAQVAVAMTEGEELLRNMVEKSVKRKAWR